MNQDNINIVSPGELYMIGKILNAEYIDYAYVAAIQDIGESFELFEKKMTDSLVAKALLEEDFSGEVVPTGKAVNLFTPVFFGNTETTLDICSIEAPAKINTFKFHFFDDQITKVTGVEDGMLQMESISNDDFNKMIDSLLPKDPVAEDVADDKAFDKEKISKYIVAKSNKIKESSRVAAYFESDNRTYKEDESGNVICVNADDFKAEIAQILTGVM